MYCFDDFTALFFKFIVLTWLKLVFYNILERSFLLDLVLTVIFMTEQDPLTLRNIVIFVWIYVVLRWTKVGENSNLQIAEENFA